MGDLQAVSTSSVEPFPGLTASTTVSDELNGILIALRLACPPNSQISFDFDGTLHVHIDVHRREDATLVENVLPTLGLGLFHKIFRGSTPHHPFFHRISAQVNK